MPLRTSPRRTARARRLAVPLLAGVGAVAIAGAATACGACDGVVSCQQAPRIGIGGQIVDRGNPTDADRAQQSGAGIPAAPGVSGVRVEVAPTGGVASGEGRAATTTDGTGWWHVDLPATGEGGATVDVIVTPPGGSGYTVRGVPVRASRRRGAGNVLGRWTRDLYLTLVGEVYNDAPRTRVDGARVSAVRRRGVEVAPTENTQAPMTTFGGGRFLYDARPLADGPVVFDFVVERDGLPTATVRDVTVYPKHEWLPPNVDGELIFVLDAAGNRVTP